ncbi:MAG TPA: hypothetical protein VKX17_16515 [Planctomycetota bacterium]|nr:hypothetical protein [Planctomycetota bacterium]
MGVSGEEEDGGVEELTLFCQQKQAFNKLDKFDHLSRFEIELVEQKFRRDMNLIRRSVKPGIFGVGTEIARDRWGEIFNLLRQSKQRFDVRLESLCVLESKSPLEIGVRLDRLQKDNKLRMRVSRRLSGVFRF